MPKTLIFTATFNEKGNIENLINQINLILNDVDILIVDDNSPDGTGDVLKNLMHNHKNLKVIHREKKYEKFITMDADLSHEPKEIPKIIKVLDEEAFVIGSRYVKGGTCEMSLLRTAVSVIGNKIIKHLLNFNCNEFTTSFRGFNINKLENFDLKLVESKGYSFFMETIFRLNQKGVRINEIPIRFRNRIQGKSKIPKLELFRTLKNLLLLKYFG